MADDQGQAQGQESNQIAELFQNVGQGIQLIGQYVQGATPDALPMVEDLMQRYQQLVQTVAQARQGGEQQAPQGQPGPAETGGQPGQQAF